MKTQNQENEDPKPQENSDSFGARLGKALGAWWVHAIYLLIITVYYVPHILLDLGFIDESGKIYTIYLVIVLWLLIYFTIAIYVRKIGKGQVQKKVIKFAYDSGYEQGKADTLPTPLFKDIVKSVEDFIKDLATIGMERQSQEILKELPKHPGSWVKFIKYGYGKPDKEDNELWINLTTNLIITYLQRLAEIRDDDINSDS